MTRTRLILISCICLCLAAPASAQRRRSGTRAAGGGAAHSDIAAKAAEARTAGRNDEAIELYRRGVRAKPTWDEGWWYLATLLYDQDKFDEAAPAFANATRLRPTVGTSWVMLG